MNAKPLGAVLGLLAQALAELAAVAGRGRDALADPQVLALGAAHRPLAPHLPAAVH